MIKMYEGSAPCPGCGCTGSDKPRRKKDGLCSDCEEALGIGKSIVKERNLDRNYYRLEELTIGELTWYRIPISEVDKALRLLLASFSRFDIKYAYGRGELVGRADACTARDSYVMPRVVFDAAKELCASLRNACQQLKEDRNNYQKELDAKLAEQKNDIFNEGVESGRNLLFQLNNGDITLDDFSKRIKKY